ncbi:MAG: flagellar basal body P-ring protein FlgI [Candidatus Hydrogenedentota bacterium]|nr:MAG: flagellar basal body P-ring protein FlgI [Candidatus Hydrogenedentota bacterium]
MAFLGTKKICRKTRNKSGLVAALIGFVLLVLPATVQSASKIKDIAFVRGVRSNQLVGYGLVAGLDGTGDGRRIPFTSQMLANMVNQFGVTFETRQLRAENVAAVMVTAELPPYAKEGTRIDAVVSTIGDAESLLGGTLLLTALRGADNEIYAVAQGPLSIGGFETRARRGGQQKHLAVGVVPGGAIVEKEVPSTIVSVGRYLTLCLKRADFTNASRIAHAINLHFHQICAEAVDAGTVRVAIPNKYMDDRVAFISEIESTHAEPDVPAKVVINERTGTVVVGHEAVITPVAISHGDITITVAAPSEEAIETPLVEGHFAEISGANVGEVAAALNVLGVLPQDMIAIFQAIERAGALQAQLELM